MRNPKHKKIIASSFAALVLAVFAGSLFAVPLVFAADGASNPGTAVGEVTAEALGGNKATVGTANSPGDIFGGAADALETLDDKILKPALQAGLFTILQNFVQNIMDRIAYEAAIAIATGAQGQRPLIFQKTGEELFMEFGVGVLGSELLSALGDAGVKTLGVDICKSPDPLLNLSLQIGIKQAYQPKEARCDVMQTAQDWGGFINSQVALATEAANDPNAAAQSAQSAIFKEIGKSLKPGKNELSASIDTNIVLMEKIAIKRNLDFQQALADGGFKPVTDFVTGQVKTPANTLQTQFNKDVVDSQGTSLDVGLDVITNNPQILWMMLFQSLSIFTNTLLSNLFNAVYDGFFAPQPEVVDLFNPEALNVDNRQAAIERFSSLRTVQPTSIDNYNILAEFVVCPSGGVANRNINNCVLDQGFAAAVSRAESDIPLTVQEAIDEGLLHGDWPLINPSDTSKNQDPFCHTYGYCHGNLVKLRKARILPVGFEMAAERNSVANPATLQEIIDGFDNCGPGGTIGSGAERFCHLVDPNWVLKYPETQCKAFVNGEIPVSSLAGVRAGVCVDTPSCISEDASGNCTGGYGYCTEEVNVWRFRGEDCPEQFSSCLSFTNVRTQDRTNYLLNTVEFEGCDADVAGCRWYRTNKYLDNNNTVEDPTDDFYSFLPQRAGATPDIYSATVWDGTALFESGTSSRSASAVDPDTGDTINLYDTYTHEDRVYLTGAAQECSQAEAGCTELFPIRETLVLNVIPNSNFENDGNFDGNPDAWRFGDPSNVQVDPGLSFSGEVSLQLTDSLSQDGIPITGGNFYTMSFYAHSDPGSDFQLTVTPVDAEGSLVPITGLSFTGDCTVSGGAFLMDPTLTGEYERYTCSFTAPADAAFVNINADANGTRLDALQLELGELVTGYTEDYNNSDPFTSYLRLPPDYLNCTGAPTDPAECDQYTGMCTAQDVGCLLYTPEDGDPSVPAVVSELDFCPNECVGYTTYKQEPTKYETEKFPLFFIADQATVCSAEYVGCDSFTNLGDLTGGGETVEHFTDLRACLTPSVAGNRASVYFTWEGSESAGFQLQSWNLLESGLTTSGGRAPCTHWAMDGADNMTCQDTPALIADPGCDAHDDILDPNNADCREFFDELGNIHYRRYSETVSISNSCQPYRKDDSTVIDCSASGGFFTASGDCRYFGLAEESAICPVEANGCRMYTGGAGRNAVTILNDGLEDGTTADYMASTGGQTVAYSTESLAPDGHSIRVSNADAGEGFATLQASVGAVCADSDGCAGTNPNYTDGCTVEEGETACGILVDSLVPGKTFIVQFWAKGGGSIDIAFEENGGAGISQSFGSADLDGAWELYSFGPMDTSNGGFEGFDENAVLSFKASGGQPPIEFFIDNIQIKQVEDNITLIKDSWVVPSSCDTNPAGIDSPQYYLGCEAYTSSAGDLQSIYQFTNLCSQDKVGCQAFYDTQNSDSPNTVTHNARCKLGPPADTAVANGNADCSIDGQFACTIPNGQNFCLFDYQGTLNPLPFAGDGEDRVVITNGGIDVSGSVVLGPEAQVVDGDRPIFAIDDGSASCFASVAGCMEVAEPKFNQAKTQVTEFVTKYYINDPDTYEQTLCSQESLFCEEWSSDKGNYYFKHPIDQTCEYKTGVAINNVEFFGWFRKGTEQPCEWTDVNNNDIFEPFIDDSLLIRGEYFGVLFNGQSNYDDWVASCEPAHNLCTTFHDVVDTANGQHPSGKPYYFVDNNLISDEGTISQSCENKVSQKLGCALFNDVTETGKTYAADPTYVVSNNADAFFGDPKFSLQDPIDCSKESGGEVFLPELGDVVDLCAQRCAYKVGNGPNDKLRNDRGTRSTLNDEYMYAGSCLTDTDCPTLQDQNRDPVVGTCRDTEVEGPDGSTNSGDADIVRYKNDTNRIISVIRDRECGAWLACKNSQRVWDAEIGRYKDVCFDIDMCVESGALGDTGFCTLFESSEPIPLTPHVYAQRNISWNGSEFSGYSIPDQLAMDLYDQIDINPRRGCQVGDGKYETFTGAFGVEYVLSCDNSPSVCSAVTQGGSPIACNDNGDCKQPFTSCDREDNICRQSCVTTEPDVRLGYIAGECSVGTEGESCVVGRCENSEFACSSDDDCEKDSEGDPIEACITGNCQLVTNTVCFDNATCEAAHPGAYPVCDSVLRTCVNQLATDGGGCTANDQCETGASLGNEEVSAFCAIAPTTIEGSCVQGQCLTNIQRAPFSKVSSEIIECRGYPEANAPYPTSQVVEPGGESWDEKGTVQPTDTNPPYDPYLDDTPKLLKSGFQNVETCDPIVNENGQRINDDCLCSYKKVQYSGGAVTKYYPIDYTERPPNGVCVGGNFDGRFCDRDIHCKPYLEGESAPDGERDENAIGSCTRVSDIQNIHGLPGFCVERDQSITLFGNPAASACLTWLPVDRPVGATDLNAQYVNAGFGTENAQYCASLDIVYDIGTSDLDDSDLACAESDSTAPFCPAINQAYWEGFFNTNGIDDDGDGDSGDDNTEGEAVTETCWLGAYCPPGFFGVITHTCARVDENDDESAALCNEDWNFFDPETNAGDLDCPYFCVPKASFKSASNDSDRLDKGDECIPPDDFDDEEVEASHLSNTYQSNGAPSGYLPLIASRHEICSSDSDVDCIDDDAWGFMLYAVDNEEFNKLRIDYKHCEVSSITEADAKASYFYLQRGTATSNKLGANYQGNASSGTSFRGLRFEISDGEYACNAIVQTASDNPEEYNYAWSDRVWYQAEAIDRYQIDTENNNLQYVTSTAQRPFGTSITVADKLSEDGAESGIPIFPMVCAAGTDRTLPVLTESGDECSGSFKPGSGGDEARSYSDLVLRFIDRDHDDNGLYSPAYDEWCADPEDTGGTCSTCVAVGQTQGQEEYEQMDDEDAANAYCNGVGGPNPITCDTDTGFCANGPVAGRACGNNDDCRVLRCYDAVATVDTGEESGGGGGQAGSKFEDVEFGDGCYLDDGEDRHPETGGLGYFLGFTEGQDVIKARLQQIFARSISAFSWRSLSQDAIDEITDQNITNIDIPSNETRAEYVGGYKDLQNLSPGDQWHWDITHTGFGNQEPQAPIISSVGECDAKTCEEKTQNAFSVNGIDDENIRGVDRKQAILTFYAHAHHNQLPIRRIVVDWGDGTVPDTPGFDVDWPTDSQVGTLGPMGWYRNARGGDKPSGLGTLEQICTDESQLAPEAGNQEFGRGQHLSSCDPQPYTFVYEYTCNEQMIQRLEGRECDGPNPVSPCLYTQGESRACGFIPRVFVEDNWGWCTGTCPGGFDGTPGCYNGESQTGSASQNECNFEDCPGEGVCPPNKNPWVYYDGLIIVEP